MSKKEEYENLFLHLINGIEFGLKLDLSNDEIMDEYYLTGRILDNNFDIYIGDNDFLSVSYHGSNQTYEEQLLTCLSDYKGVSPEISYTIKDLNDVERNIKVYEWGVDLERSKKIESSELVDYPQYIVDVKRLASDERQYGKK